MDGQNAEESPLGKTIFGEMIANCDLARENNVPVCQDTGMAIVFAEIGQDVHLTGGSFEDAVTEKASAPRLHRRLSAPVGGR